MLIAQTPHLQIHRLYAHNSLRNYTYVLVETASKQAVVIDPWDGEAVLDWAKTHELSLSGILNTHLHHDHVRGNAHLHERGVQLIEKIENVFQDIAEKHTWHTPGHTMEHKVFWLKDDGSEFVFVGDTLFQAGVGNCKNGGDPKTLFKTLEELKTKLSLNAKLLPGHDYLERNLAFAHYVDPGNQAVENLQEQTKSSVTYELPPLDWKRELELNPFLRAGEQSIRENLENKFGLLANLAASDEMVFIQLRNMRDNW